MDDDAAERFRTGLQTLKPRRAPKLHWTESDGRHRMQVVEHLLLHEWRGLAVVGLYDTAVKSERRRRLTLERMLVELIGVGVGRVVLESRGPADRSDRAHVDALKAQRVLRGLRVDHRPGAAEPLLWAADAVCGLVGRARQEEPRFLEAVRHRLEVVENRR